MSQHATLSANRREGTGKGVARKLRAGGRIPAVVYGGGMEAVSLTLDVREADRVFHSVSVENTILTLNIGEGGESAQVLVREIQTHSYKPIILHVDFMRVETGVALDLSIPIHLEGTPRGVKEDGGVLEHLIHDLAIRCIPSLIPEAAQVDVSGLEIGESLNVSDITLAAGVEILTDLELAICVVSAPRLAVEAEEDTGEEEATEVPRVGETEVGEGEPGGD